MNKYTSIKMYNKSSAKGRLLMAFLMVMGFLCVFVGKSYVLAQFQYKPVDAHITFDCKKIIGVEGNIYQISIKSETSTAPVPEKDTVTVNNEGKGEFVLRLTEPGTYDYLLYQVKGSDENIKYDDTKYDVHVCVFSDADGKLSYSVAVNIADTDDKPESVEFKNAVAGDTRTTEAPPKIDPPDRKNVKTGDSSMVILMMIIAMMSLAGITVIVEKKLRK